MGLQTGHFEEAQVLRDHELELKEKLVRKHQLNMMGKLSQELGIRPDPVGQEQAVFTRPPLVSVADVEAVVSSWSGVPMQQITADETSRLRQLEPALKVCGLALPCTPCQCHESLLNKWSKPCQSSRQHSTRSNTSLTSSDNSVSGSAGILKHSKLLLLH